MNLKKQRFVLIVIIAALAVMYLVYGTEGATQTQEYESIIDRQAAQLKDKQEQIEMLEIILEHQEPQEEEQQEKIEPEQTSLGEYTITAYCGCEICCGEYALNRPNGIVYGAEGVELKEGISVASPLPFGTKILINGHEYISQDKTADWIAEKYDGKIIDVYFEKHENAVAFGKQIQEVYEIGEKSCD